METTPADVLHRRTHQRLPGSAAELVRHHLKHHLKPPDKACFGVLHTRELGISTHLGQVFSVIFNTIQPGTGYALTTWPTGTIRYSPLFPTQVRYFCIPSIPEPGIQVFPTHPYQTVRSLAHLNLVSKCF